MDLVCVGDLMLDVRADADAMASGGDVHGRVLVRPGGTSANAAVWAASTGAASGVIGAVGTDVPGDLLHAALIRHNVSTDGIVRREASTGTMLVLHEAGERSMVADRGANATLTPDDLPPTIDAATVLVSGYLVLQSPTTATAIAAIERAAAELVAVEAASWPLLESFGVDRFLASVPESGAVLANAREAAVITGCEPEEACRLLGERFRVAAVKRGHDGACLCFEGSFFASPAPTIEELDPTGAGDAFDGVLLASLARGAPPDEALRAACEAGARVAARVGAWPESPAGTT